MANFAKIGLDNIVLDVQLIDTINNMTPEGVEDETVGCAYLAKLLAHETWLQTSFNTRGGVHLQGGTPFRKNYAEVGGYYDSSRDAFIPAKPYPSWVLDEDTCMWEPPVAVPQEAIDGTAEYRWDEETVNWVVIT
jgi:hypothetical protein